MTRSEFAAAALQGLLAEYIPLGCTSTSWSLTKALTDLTSLEQRLARASFMIADAMMAEQEKRDGTAES